MKHRQAIAAFNVCLKTTNTIKTMLIAGGLVLACGLTAGCDVSDMEVEGDVDGVPAANESGEEGTK